QFQQLEKELESSREETNRCKVEIYSRSYFRRISVNNAQIRRQLSIREVQLAEKEEEMRGFASTLKTVVALKNKKIKELELKLLESMNDQRVKEPAAKKRKIGERGDEEERIYNKD
ncbi:hypothetical protein PFISCL1PPCAC_20307, partial [Pristionchus fissidentatus]